MSEAQGAPLSASRELSLDGLSKVSLGVAVFVPAALVIFSASPLGPDFLYVMLGIPALLLLWALGAVGAAFAAVRNLRRRKFIRAAILAVPAFVIAAAAFNPIAFVRFCDGLGDYVHLAFMQRYYQRLALAGQHEPPRLVVFNRGGMIWFSTGIAYDESDEAALPPSRQSAAWKARAAKTELSCGYSATHLWGHFYSVGMAC